MTLQQLQNEGFILTGGGIFKRGGQKFIKVFLKKRCNVRYRRYITSCPCSDALLNDAHFIEPILLENMTRGKI